MAPPADDVKRKLNLFRKLPCSIDAEMLFLGTQLAHPERKLGNGLRHEHFSLLEHGALFAAIREAQANSVKFDILRAQQWVANDDRFDKEFVLNLSQCIDTIGNAEERAHLIIDLAAKRNLISIGENLENSAYSPDVSESASSIIGKHLEELKAHDKYFEEVSDLDRTCVSGRELLAMTFPPLPQLVKSLIVPGLTLLVAKPKVGKSWGLLDIGIGVASGTFTFGALKCLKRDVLLIMLEDSNRRLKSRLEKLLDRNVCPDNLNFRTSWRRGKQGAEDLARYLDKHPKTQLIGIDILAKIRSLSPTGSVYYDDYAVL
jgi:replicative DNA helicase